MASVSPSSSRRAASRRQFIKKAVPTLVALATSGLTVTAAKGLVDAANETASAAESDALRREFLAQARSALQEAHPLARSVGEQVSERALADLADPSGQRPTKLKADLPVLPAPLGAPAPAAQPPADQNILVRMAQELQRALQKPVDQRRWVMVIDLRKCIGCSACTVACKAENKLPPGVVYRPVIEKELGAYPHVSRRFIPRPCMQCDDPPCVPVCPVGATYKRPDGVVEIDYGICIGCRYCIAACPYGARTFDYGENYTERPAPPQPYEELASPEYGRAWIRQNGTSPVGNVRKCQFCLHRLAVGMLPACTTTCVGAATYFGDANDPESLVAELIARPNVMRLKEELGTEPKVWYLT